MKTLDEYINEQLVTERKNFKDLEQALTSYITDGLIAAWDEAGLEFTHKDVKEALEKLAKNYDVDKEISWAKEYIK